MSRTWTPEQEAELRRLYPVMTSDAIAEHFGKSPYAVRCKVYKLGLHKEQPNKIRLAAGQERWLIRNYPHMANAICALYLGMSIRTVVRNARRLGLAKTREFMKEAQAHTARCAAESRRRHGTYPPKGVANDNLRKGAAYQFQSKTDTDKIQTPTTI